MVVLGGKYQNVREPLAPSASCGITTTFIKSFCTFEGFSKQNLKVSVFEIKLWLGNWNLPSPPLCDICIPPKTTNFLKSLLAYAKGKRREWRWIIWTLWSFNIVPSGCHPLNQVNCILFYIDVIAIRVIMLEHFEEQEFSCTETVFQF